jgi:uncharacterized protein
MRWRGGRRSENVEDRRGDSAPQLAAGAPVFLRLLPLLLRSRGGRYLLVFGALALLGAYFLGIDVSALFQPASRSALTPSVQQAPSAADQELADFVTVVLADTEDTWREQFAGFGRQYEDPRLVLFTGSVRSACGSAGSATGPFYCPADHKVYLDLSFFDDLQRRHGAPGDFAQAYVIAHEVGHHVQTLLGISAKIQEAGRAASREQVSALSVRQELQADCFAGLWGHHAERTRQILDPGDLEEALGAASAIGDDRLQREARGYAVPDSFTHGSSAQRVRWFRNGFDSGDAARCDTFKATQL